MIYIIVYIMILLLPKWFSGKKFLLYFKPLIKNKNVNLNVPFNQVNYRFKC